VKTYEAIVKGEEVIQPGVPESFHVLLKELQGLGLSVELLNEDIERFTLEQEMEQSNELAASLGASLDWNDLSDEPLEVLDVEELSLDDGLSAEVVEEDYEDDDSDSDGDDAEDGEPSEDSLQALASEESDSDEDGIVGVEDEEN